MNNVNTDALRMAAKTLDDYVESVGTSLNNLFDAADTCRENMMDDEFSKEASENIMKNCQSIGKLIKAADELSRKIKTVVKMLED